MTTDLSNDIQQQVLAAYKDRTPLKIVGGNSKAFYGRQIAGESLNVSAHAGVISYEPTELVITARAGTLLSDIESLLNDNGQMLGFEPPSFGETATIGGTIACNLSGPRRATAGAARDFLLGCKIINGKGEILSFGGEVMKNVAGYDVSRLMAGALGTLGVLLEVSLKVLPKPEQEETLCFDVSPEQALEKIQRMTSIDLPLSANCYADGQLMIRLSGAEAAIKAAREMLGGELLQYSDNFWPRLKEQQLDFFQGPENLWRISLAPDVAPLSIEGNCLYEWDGTLRWIKTNVDANIIQSTAVEYEGHATLFRSETDEGKFQPLSPGLLRIHKNLKRAFDPENILNPDKLYSGV